MGQQQHAVLCTTGLPVFALLVSSWLLEALLLLQNISTVFFSLFF